MAGSKFKWQKAHITEEVFRKVNWESIGKRTILALVGLDCCTYFVFNLSALVWKSCQVKFAYLHSTLFK